MFADGIYCININSNIFFLQNKNKSFSYGKYLIDITARKQNQKEKMLRLEIIRKFKSTPENRKT